MLTYIHLCIFFFQAIFLPMVPFFLPLVHMALMGSVYSTVVMSLERYLRLCKVKVSTRLYIDRLAHWRSLLVDLILTFGPLALVSEGNFAITIN